MKRFKMGVLNNFQTHKIYATNRKIIYQDKKIIKPEENSKPEEKIIKPPPNPFPKPPPNPFANLPKPPPNPFANLPKINPFLHLQK